MKIGGLEGIRGLEPSRRELGVAYLVAVGLLFLGFGLYAVAVAVGRPGLPGLGTALVLASGVVLAVRPTAPELTVGLAAGGVVGSLYGAVAALEAEHSRVDALYRRNLVLQRVFRHNIRNGMIEREARAVVDLVPVVTDLRETLTEYYPEASFEPDFPASAWVAADGSVEIAVWHLLEFAIHRSGDTPVDVSLYSLQGSAKPQSLFVNGSDSTASLLRGLVGHDLVALEEGRAHLTPGGWIYVTKHVGDGDVESGTSRPRASGD